MKKQIKAQTKAENMVKRLSAVCFAIVTIGMLSCSKEEPPVEVAQEAEGKATVEMKFSPYEMSPMTRADTRAATSISSICSHLDVWITDEDDDVTDIHQSSTDDGFGTVSVALDRTKTYSLVAVAHKCADDAELDDGIIIFPDEKVTHAMVYQTTFTPAETTSLSCLMTRIVGMFRFEMTDEVPQNAYTVTFDFGQSFTRWNLSESVGTNATERITTFDNFTRNSSGGAGFTLYILPSNLTATDAMDITVTALEQDGDEIESKTFADVPVRAGYKTTYRGEFFTTEAVTGAFTVEDWNTFDTVDF